MKASQTTRYLMLFFCIALSLCGVRAQDEQPENKYIAQEKADFEKVVKHLDPYGNFFGFLNTEEAVEAIDQSVAKVEALISAALADDPDNAAKVDLAVKAIKQLYLDCGVRDIDALGVSSLRVGEKLYRNKAFFHHSPEKNNGKVWSLLGNKTHKLDCVDFMPKDTVLAGFIDFDLNVLWNWQFELVQATGNPQVAMIHQMQLANLNQKFNVQSLVESTGGQMGILLTANDESLVPIPQSGKAKPIEIPEPGIALFMKVKDDQLIKFIYGKFEFEADGEKQSLPFQEKVIEGITARSYILPLPLPIPVSPTFATIDGFLVIASSPDLMADIIKAKKGKGGLKDTDEYKKLVNNLPMEGNGFHYVSPRLSRAITNVQKQIMESKEGEINVVLSELMAEQKDESPFSVGVIQVLPDGISCQGYSSVSSAKAAVVYAAVVPVAIGAGALLPVLSKARAKARSVSSTNNLKQIGLGLLMYSGENSGRFPKPDGAAGFEVLNKDQILNVGKVYINPNDKKRSMPDNAQSITENNTSYVYFGAGLKDDNRNATIVPVAFEKPDSVSGKKLSVLFIDGHVEQIKGEFASCQDVINNLNQRHSYPDDLYKMLLDKAKKLDAKLGYTPKVR